MTEQFKGHNIQYNRKGYPYISMNGKNIMIHRFVWEQVHGKIPKGMQVHHIDGNEKNFDINNLTMLTQSDHFRIHAGWLKTDGEWSHKFCRKCNKPLPLSEFYLCIFRGSEVRSSLCKKHSVEHMHEVRAILRQSGVKSNA